MVYWLLLVLRMLFFRQAGIDPASDPGGVASTLYATIQQAARERLGVEQHADSIFFLKKTHPRFRSCVYY